MNKKIEIPSDIKYIKKISGEILGHLKRLKIDESTQFDIRLAVEEAVRNAIEHGNNCTRRLPVCVDYDVAPEKIEIEVEDSGSGFDPEELPDCTKEENLLKGGGRGVFLIHKLMDKVTYNEKGNRVKMVKFFK